MNRVWLPVAMPERLTWRAFAPSGTVTKTLLVRLRSTELDDVVVKLGEASVVGAITVASTRSSTVGVAGSLTCRIAEWAPVPGRAVTVTVVGLFSGRTTVRGAVNV